MLKYILPLLLLATPVLAQSNQTIALELTQQEASALVELINDGVKFAGLSKAEAAAVLYRKIQTAVSKPPSMAAPVSKDEKK
jgi:hypothetical protein